MASFNNVHPDVTHTYRTRGSSSTNKDNTYPKQHLLRSWSFVTHRGCVQKLELRYGPPGSAKLPSCYGRRLPHLSLPNRGPVRNVDSCPAEQCWTRLKVGPKAKQDRSCHQGSQLPSVSGPDPPTP
ncbi:hypothetical protein NXS19_002307 [Fusarium pseudograminearum]|nr:hypothetical protein NXS19_002307 [Fusarium pseudograminearum]